MNGASETLQVARVGLQRRAQWIQVVTAAQLSPAGPATEISGLNYHIVLPTVEEDAISTPPSRHALMCSLQLLI